MSLYLKNIALDINLRRHFYDEESFRTFWEELVCAQAPDTLVNIAGWCNYKTGQIVLAKDSTHTALRLSRGLPRDNLYPFSLCLEPNSKNVTLVYGGAAICEIAPYLKPMVNYIIETYLIVPAGLKIIGSVTQRIQ